MKQFFSIFFGGLALFFVGLGLFHLGAWFYRTQFPLVGKIQYSIISNAVDAFMGNEKNDGTVITGFSRTINFSASEEEDLINNATQNQKTRQDATARGYIVQNLKTGKIITSKNDEVLMPIASLTKLITAEVSKKLFVPTDHVTVEQNIIDLYGNTGGFRSDETFLAYDLLYPLLMVSSNEAAESFAYAYGRRQFIRAMNDFAQNIGAYRTYFADASGISPDNRSTAKDLAIILDWIRKNDPEVLQITELKSKTIRGHTWVNPAHFLNWSTYMGGKNGYTPEAGRTAAAIFGLGSQNEPYAVVILGSESRDTDFVNLLAEIK